MKRDLRSEPLYREIEDYLHDVHTPGLGKLADARDVRVSSDGRWVALAGKSYDALVGVPRSRIALFDAQNHEMMMLDGKRDDIFPRWSPARNLLAFLSDRGSQGRFSLYSYDPNDHVVLALAQFDGSAESLSWCPDGTQILVQTAESGAERAGAQGSGLVGADADHLPDWLPEIEGSVPAHSWRRLSICSLETGSQQLVDMPGTNFWEAEWCGSDAIIAVVSDNPREAAWFDASLAYVRIPDWSCETIYRPAYQLALPVATSDGRYVAVVEACCSDRTIVAGDVLLFDRAAAWHSTRIDTHGVDITSVCVRGENRFCFAGIRGFEVAAGEIDASDATARVVWHTEGSWLRGYPALAPVAAQDYVTVSHSYNTAPKLVRYETEKGVPAILHDFPHAKESNREVAGRCSQRSWTANDGLEIQGRFVQPPREVPCPLVVLVHGGPVWAYTNSWRHFTPLIPILVNRGFGVLLPNPRGSSGRGQPFARMVLGDVGGEESGDILTGVQALIAEGVVDSRKIAVMGASHGGYMAAWLAAQSEMFVTAICAFPVTNLFSGLFTGTPTESLPEFLDSDPFDVRGRHFTRSPVMYAPNVNAPILVIAGARDRCVGVTQGLEFHRALVHSGKQSELVTYPEEGHGVQRFETYLDYCTRVVCWLELYASGTRSRTS